MQAEPESTACEKDGHRSRADDLKLAKAVGVLFTWWATRQFPAQESYDVSYKVCEVVSVSITR